MRINRLDLKAYGSFTERTLEFSSGESDIHVVFGPNEAGKSTSLRALKALLYGFPERTTDNFEHANRHLMVGGCLEGVNGQKLNFYRRKRRKADILDFDGKIMDREILVGFLHGVEPALFESLYGIDHNSLMEGGEDILAQKGEVGQLLFAAGAGVSSLKKIIDSLDSEAGNLFKSRGVKQEINRAVKEFKELKKCVREASLSSSKWKDHTRRLKEMEREQFELEELSRQKSMEMQRLNRLRKAIPELSELKILQEQLEKLGPVVILPPEFSTKLEQVQQDIREIKLQIEKDKHRLRNIQTRQDGLYLKQELLDHAETIEDLYQRLGEYRKGQRDRNKLDGMRIVERKNAGTLIEEIRPDLTLKDAISFRPLLGRKRTIQELSSQHEVLKQKLYQVRKLRDEAEQEVGEVGEILSGLPVIKESSDLSKTVKLAQRMGGIDEQIEQISRDIYTGKKNCLAELQRLGMWSGDLVQLLSLTLPLQETVRRYESNFTEVDRKIERLKKERKKAESELKVARRDSRELIYGVSVPSEEYLEESRKKRQEGWQLLRRQWIDGENISLEAEKYGAGTAVHLVYEKNVEQADHVADRLRREAAQVAKAASLRASIEDLEETVSDILQKEQEASGIRSDFMASWQIEWKSVKITPLSPGEMSAWLTDIDKLRFRVTEIFSKEGELAEKEKIRQRCRTALVEELEILGEAFQVSGRELAPVLVFTESLLEKISLGKIELEKLREKQRLAEKALEKARYGHKNVMKAMDDWQRRWEKVLSDLDIESHFLPSEVLDLVEIIADCFGKLEKAKDLQSRINGIDRDTVTFTSDVQALLEKTVPDLRDLTPDQAVLQLHALLGKARQDDELLKKGKIEIEELRAEIESAKSRGKSLNGQMTEFFSIARCGNAVDLVESIKNSLEYQRLQAKISDVESSLAKVTEGVPLDKIISQADSVEIDELPGEIAFLQRQIEDDLYPRLKDVLKLIGKEKGELQRMDGNAQAAEAAEGMAQVGARIQRLVGEYIRMKVAAAVLRNEIERYRKEHQDPVLQIASRLFVELTLGSFAGLRTDVDDGGNSILVGMRRGDTSIAVDGMSSGTRDQLYLALRMATLEWRLETCEPMPFIVDDILINFDDDRSMATLRALAKLSEKNQIIIFTHHRQIVESARKIAADVQVYEL